MQKKCSLGGGISEKLCSDGGIMKHEILFYSRAVKFWNDIPWWVTSLNGTALRQF